MRIYPAIAAIDLNQSGPKALLDHILAVTAIQAMELSGTSVLTAIRA